MKQVNHFSKAVLLAAIFFLTVNTSKAQSSSDPYTNGSVWTMQMINVKPGMMKEYTTSLKNTVKLVNDEAVKQGLILSYKILSGASANPDDFNFVILTEYKNMAAMEGKEDQWDAIRAKIMGNDDAQKQIMQTRTAQRDIYGSKMMREIILK
ncbi:MAG: hypothetical protein JST18_06560 [Bacteroidetes bacterium]|nr:hypothetical protein [Bacteroidota bacterium]